MTVNQILIQIVALLVTVLQFVLVVSKKVCADVQASNSS